MAHRFINPPNWEIDISGGSFTFPDASVMIETLFYLLSMFSVRGKRDMASFNSEARRAFVICGNRESGVALRMVFMGMRRPFDFPGIPLFVVHLSIIFSPR